MLGSSKRNHLTADFCLEKGKRVLKSQMCFHYREAPRRGKLSTRLILDFKSKSSDYKLNSKQSTFGIEGTMSPQERLINKRTKLRKKLLCSGTILDT